jgi:glycosyltransferase involved in cell wall biosynthesis
MKINLISFLDPTKYSGGGEMITRSLIECGIKRNHDIKISSVRPKILNNLHTEADLNILVDVFNNAHSIKSLGAWRSFKYDFLSSIINRTPFVHLTNAYADICNLPYLPCSGNRSNPCITKTQLSFTDKLVTKDFKNDCFSSRSIVKRLYKESKLNIYLSPLHQNISEKVIDSSNLPESFILKPLINTGLFFNRNIERDIDYLFVGIIGEAKGFSEIKKRFKDTNIHFIGKLGPNVDLDFGTHHGHIPYDQIPDYMNRAKNFVFLPRWPEPQGRVIAEASLCGCKIVGNENIGALSFPMDLSDPENYTGVEDEFWNKIESLKL